LKHAEREGNGKALPIIDLGARRGWAINTTQMPYPQEKRTSTHCTARWDSEPEWANTENLSPTGVLTPVK
jgi:hypothetical protein